MTSPVFHCGLCSRRIAARGRHVLLPGGTVICGPCADGDDAHARVYPGCPQCAHGLHDHGYLTLTRATLAWLFGKVG